MRGTLSPGPAPGRPRPPKGLPGRVAQGMRAPGGEGGRGLTCANLSLREGAAWITRAIMAR